jgi:hypothetical protein
MIRPVEIVMSTDIAQMYDALFDHFDQNEDLFVHTCIDALFHYIEGGKDPLWMEIHQRLVKYDNKETSEEATSENSCKREVLLEDEKSVLLAKARKDFPAACIGDLLLTGVTIACIMKSIVDERPSAALYRDGQVFYISTILCVRPQLLS